MTFFVSRSDDSHLYQGYGPGVPDGYGACYAFNEHCIKIGISCVLTPACTVDVDAYRAAVANALLDLRALCSLNPVSRL